MDRFESMTAFVAVAKAGGFSAAARKLGIPLATISRRVADLEATLGARLLHRSTRQVALSEAGQAYFAASQRLLEDLKDAEEAVTGEYRIPRGDLTITAPVGFGRLQLQPVLMEFLATYPDINLRLMLADRIVDIVEEQVEVALRIAHLPDSAMMARALGHVSMVVCASPGYLERRGTLKHPRELTQHACIAWSTMEPRHTWWFREDGADLSFPIAPRLSTTHAESALDAAYSGLGLLQVPSYQAAQGVRDGRLAVVLKAFECAPTPVNLLYPASRMLPLKLRAFITFAAPRLVARLHSIAGIIGA